MGPPWVSPDACSPEDGDPSEVLLLLLGGHVLVDEEVDLDEFLFLRGEPFVFYEPHRVDGGIYRLQLLVEVHLSHTPAELLEGEEVYCSVQLALEGEDFELLVVPACCEDHSALLYQEEAVDSLFVGLEADPTWEGFEGEGWGEVV